MRRKWLPPFTVTFWLAWVLSGIIVIWLLMAWYHFLTTPLISKGHTTVIVNPHTHLKQFAQELAQQGYISRADFFVLLMRLRGDAKKLRVGEYAVDSNTTPRKLITDIANGRVVMRKITLVEGMTFTQIRQAFATNPALQKTIELQTDDAIMTALGSSQSIAEGHFFPNTYLFTWGNKDFVILQQAYQKMSEILSKEWEERADNLPYTHREQALIVASLVESEAALDDERRQIAGVILNRLQKNMYLQIDPTVLYGVHKPFGSVITAQDLADKNRYNTYRHLGLPPSAINMPSAASIHAALHPTMTRALYYMLQADGRHHFSTSYAEHLRAVRKYREFKLSMLGTN